MMRKSWLLASVFAASMASAGIAQDAPKKLSLDALFASPSLSGPSLRGLQLSPDGTMVTLLKARPDETDRYDLWAIDTTTGAERMLVDSKKIGTGAALSEAEKMQRERQRIGGEKGIVSYDWAPDGKHLLVPIDGQLYLADTTGAVTRLTDVKGGTLNPLISPKGTYLSYVGDNELVVEPIATRQPQAITQGASDTVSWGTAEFVAQEEMDRSTGYWWSPNEKYIAVQRTDVSPVKVVTRTAIGSDGAKVYDQRYPAAGTPNALVDLYVMKPDGSGKVKVDMGSNPDIYLARVYWSADGNTLYVAETETARLWAFDVQAPGVLAKAPFPSPHGGRLMVGLGGFQRFDSLAVEAGGNICVATLVNGSVSVVAPTGGLIRQVPMPDMFCTNICFGGADLRTAYMTLSGTGQLVAMDWPEPGLRLAHAP